MSSHSRGTSGKPGLKWLVMSSDAGSSVHQHGKKSCGTARVRRSLAYELTRRSYAPGEPPQIPDFWDRRPAAADLASPSMHEPRDAHVRRQAAGARTPEDLATQLEDAFIVRDPGGLAELFDEHAVLSPRDSDLEVRGSEQIASFATAHWEADLRYLAQIRR